MKNTTLCYIKKDNQYLMLHRIKKKNDDNKNKWIGVGGKFEEGESPDECLLREVYEETGLRLTKYDLRGVITFTSDIYETEYMFLYTATEYEGDLASDADGNLIPIINGVKTPCDEGVLRFIDINKIPDLNLWEGDRVFLKRLNDDNNFFTMKLCYEGDRLIKVID